MEPRTLEYIAAACGGELQGGAPETVVTGVSTDSRAVKAGEVFFAVKGERFDGHQFLPEVARKGAAALVISRQHVLAEPVRCPLIRVEDSRRALVALAGQYRRDYKLTMIAVGGSNGKTSTKELLASVLRQKGPTLWSEASFNNDIGVPATLLKLEAKHQAAVVEVGTNHPGELAPLVKCVQPDIGVITNIGPEHLEFFGDLEGVAQEEGSLAELLPDSGRLYVHGDSTWGPAIEGRTKAQSTRIGLGDRNVWRVEHVQMDSAGTSFQAVGPRLEFHCEYRIQLLGVHQALNALFAVAVGADLGLSPAQVRAGLGECRRAKMRMEVLKVKGLTILNDAYNANAASTSAALETLSGFPCEGRRIVVLGTMAELGAHSSEAHAEAGRRAAQLGIDHLLAIGPWAGKMTEAARAEGLKSATTVADVSEAAAALKEFALTGDVILLKGSRVAAVERIISEL